MALNTLKPTTIYLEKYLATTEENISDYTQVILINFTGDILIVRTWNFIGNIFEFYLNSILIHKIIVSYF